MKTTYKISFVLSILLLQLLFCNCSTHPCDEVTYGNWVEAVHFDGDKRSGAASFVIDDVVYLGLGCNTSRAEGEQYFPDFWAYSGGSSWNQVDSFPGEMRQCAFSFAIDGKGYVGCGHQGDSIAGCYSDVWEFDPQADTHSQWTQLPDFVDGGLTEMTSFVVDGKAYATGGRNETYDAKKNCYEFNAFTGVFSEIPPMNYKRSAAFSFVIHDRAYVGGGYDNYLVNSFECFDASTKTWLPNGSLRDLYLPKSITEKMDHYDVPLNLTRAWAVAFSVDGRGYVASGNNGNVLSDCWVYDPSTDLWTEKNSFQYNMSARIKASSFIIDEIPYISLGRADVHLDDMWYFESDADEDEND